MGNIANDADFRKAIEQLPAADQRKLAMLFVEDVLEVAEDAKLKKVAAEARTAASEEDKAENLKAARRVTLDCHTRCGAEGDWKAQADYFIARALIEAVTPPEKGKSGRAAWQAAMAARMVRTCLAIDAEVENSDNTAQRQYDVASKFLASK